METKWLKKKAVTTKVLLWGKLAKKLLFSLLFVKGIQNIHNVSPLKQHKSEATEAAAVGRWCSIWKRLRPACWQVEAGRLWRQSEQWAGCGPCPRPMCANTAASLWPERAECLTVGEIMTPLTGLIHTQFVAHPEKKNPPCKEILPTEHGLCQLGWG